MKRGSPSRTHQILCGAIALLLAAVAWFQWPRDSRGRWNVILVSLDTLRPDHVGLYGAVRPTTPNLDRLARESVLFCRAWSHAPETRPAHFSFFTSQWPFVHQRARGLPMLAEVLRDSGYATIALTDGGEVAGEFGFQRGFDLYADHGGGLAKHVKALENYLDAEAPRRFFAFLHTYEIHDPYDPGGLYETLFAPDYQGKVRGKNSERILRSIRGIGQYKNATPPILTAGDKQKIRALYDGGIRSTDRAVGMLHEALASRGLLEKTLVMVVSDHGDEFWEHGSVLHAHTLYEELLGMVALIRIPDDGAKGHLQWAPFQGIDLAPTILALLELPPMPTAAGRAWSPKPSLDKRPFYGEKRTNFALVDWPYKIIGQIGSQENEIYNLQADPGESNSLKDSRLRSRLLEEVGRARGRIKENVQRFRTAYPAKAPEEPEPETLEQLRRLGYIE